MMIASSVGLYPRNGSLSNAMQPITYLRKINEFPIEK